MVCGPEASHPILLLRSPGCVIRELNLANSHSVFPTLTMVNAAAMGTSHFPRRYWKLANIVYTGFAVQSANGSVVPMIENDAMLAEINDHFGANYLNEESILAAARKQGF